MRRKYLIIFLSGIIFLSLLFNSSVYGYYTKSGNDLSIPSSETINGSGYFSGNNLDIKGKYSGDVFCAGGNINIDANISGDVLCVGQNITIYGNVDGNVRLAGQSIRIDGTVGKNASIAAQSVTISGSVLGEMATVNQDFTVNGTITKEVYGAMQNALIAGTLLNNFDANVNKLTVSNGARINGDLNYSSPNKGDIANGTVKGKTNYTYIKPAEETNKTNPVASILASIIYWIIALMILGLVLIFIFTPFLAGLSDVLFISPWATLGIGVIIFFLTPLISFFLLVTIIGIPLAFILMLLWMVGLILSPLIIAFTIGRAIMKGSFESKKGKMLLALFIGLIIISILFNIPLLGAVLMFLTFLFGLGSLFRYFRSSMARSEVKTM